MRTALQTVPSVTEGVLKIRAESFEGVEQLGWILAEARTIVRDVRAGVTA